MLTRILTALVGIPLVILLLFGWNGTYFIIGVGLMSVLGAHEFYRAVKQQGRGKPVEWIGLFTCAGLVTSARYADAGILFWILTAGILLGLLAEVFRSDRASISNVGTLLTGILYTGWLFVFPVLLRTGFPEDLRITGIPGEYDRGAFLMLFTLLTIWAADTFAYFSGRFFGKRKLCPSLSPGKTVVGAAGGFLGAAVVGALVGNWFQIPAVHALVIGAIAGVFAILGDLVESAMKRDLGVKDFGTLLPGHGGILDRFDSTLFVSPFVYAYVRFILGWG